MIDFDVPVYAPPFPAGLTHDPEKVRYFAGDSYFLEAYEQLATITADPVAFATRHALLLMKPDAIVSRSVEPIVDWLRESGFRIVAARRTRITRGGVRAMWHYQLNRATPQRSKLADTLIGSSDSLVLLLRTDDDTGVPPSVSLTGRKGPPDPARREPGQLRARLGDFGFLLNMVHASDEPADIIRELGILFEDSGRRALCTQALADTDHFDAAAALTRQLYAEVPAQDLRFAPAAARLAEAVERLLADEAVVPEAVRGDLRALLDAATIADQASWGPLVELIWRADLPVIGWDLTIVACSALPMTRPQYTQLLSGADPAHWRQPATAAAR